MAPGAHLESWAGPTPAVGPTYARRERSIVRPVVGKRASRLPLRLRLQVEAGAPA